MNMQDISAASAEGQSILVPDDLAGIRECAKALKVNASTISRQLGRGLYKNWGSESAPKVSVAEVRQARADALNPAQQRQPAPRQQRTEPNGYASERAAREKINRTRDEISLGEKLATILDRADVEDDFETFGRRLRERLRQRAPTLILELEQFPTTQAREAHLVASDEKLLAELADELESLANAGGAAAA